MLQLGRVLSDYISVSNICSCTVAWRKYSNTISIVSNHLDTHERYSDLRPGHV